MSSDSKKTQDGTDIGGTIRRASRVDSRRIEALTERLADRAEREGLLDVVFAETDSPVGRLLLAATPRGLVKVSFPIQPLEEVLERLANEISPRVLESPPKLDQARRELDLYFEGRLREFDLPLDWQLSHGFYRKVLRAAAHIPYGQTRSYSELAKRAGSPRAVRATGSALGSNPLPIIVPCHRVLRSGGALGGYGGGVEVKRTLLELEGALQPGS